MISALGWVFIFDFSVHYNHPSISKLWIRRNGVFAELFWYLFSIVLEERNRTDSDASICLFFLYHLTKMQNKKDPSVVFDVAVVSAEHNLWVLVTANKLKADWCRVVCVCVCVCV